MKIWIGTSGFQYPEWKGKFYPEKMPTSKMLAYYSERFTSTESNYTFRHIPSEKTIRSWSDGTPPHFKFSFKAPQRITHFSKLRDCAEILAVFHRPIALAGDKLGAVLFQLPPTFPRDVDLLKSFLADIPNGIRAAFEFRHPSWFDDAVYHALRSANAALCIAENEDLATPVVSTANFGYLRLRREDYEVPQIKQWAQRIDEQRSRWKECFIYFKHEERAAGPEFARQMQLALGE